jgi:ABC-2 type transport system permease protein
MNKNIFRKTVSERLRPTIAYCVGILAYMLMLTAVYPTYKKMMSKNAALLKNYPKGVLQLFGVKSINAASFSNYMTLELFGFIWIIILAAFVIAFTRNMVSGELHEGTLELLMAQPVARWKILTSEGVALLLGIVSFVTVTIVGILALGSAFASGSPVSYAGFASFLPVGICMALAIGGYSALFSVLIDDPRLVIMASAALTLFFYIMHFVGIYSKVVSKIDWFGIFHYWDPTGVIASGSVPWKSVLILLAFAAVGFALAIFAFQRKDIK